MLTLLNEKHIAFYDNKKQFYSSFTFSLIPETLKKSQKKTKQQKDYKNVVLDQIFLFNFKIQNNFTYQWTSEYFHINRQIKNQKYDMMPFSIETYLNLFNDPRKIKFELTPKNNNTFIEELFNKPIGKLIIKSNFNMNPFTIPTIVLSDGLHCQKNIKVIIIKDQQTSVICSGELVDIIQAEQVEGFQVNAEHNNGFKIYEFTVCQNVRQDNIVIMKGKIIQEVFSYEKINIRIISTKNKIDFICNLKEVFSRIKSFMQLQNITIIQGVNTQIQDGHHVVFYSQASTLYSRAFRSYLHSKIRDKWIIEGIIHYNRNHKHFQDCMSELSQLIGQGQQLFPLENQDYCFDEVWKAKAKVIYHILSNMKSLADNGGRSLTSFIIGLSKKRKVTSLNLLTKLKNSYGLDNIKKTYYEQFIASIGMNRIFYQLTDFPRESKLKITLRQKSLLVKIYKLYNLFRIKLEHHYSVVSPLTQRIMKKNKYDESSKKKDLSGPLCVPKFLKAIPYFTGVLSIQIDNCPPFNFELQQQNIMQKIENTSSLKSKRISNRKASQWQSQGFTCMMVDTSGIFPAIYKNQNTKDKVIQSMLKRQYESQHEQFKVLNAISTRQHSENETICRILIEKVKIKVNKQNSTINIKRKVLQILSIFMNKVKDVELWEDILALLKLYEPVCYDLSQDGNLFMHSLIQAIGNITYRKQYSYYFQEFHRIFLAISKYHKFTTQLKEQQLRKQIMKSIMNWKSTYSLQIVSEVKQILQLCISNITEHKTLLKIIIENVIPYLRKLNLKGNSSRLQKQVQELIEEAIQKDHSGQLYATKFQIQLQWKEEALRPLDFLMESFKKLQEIKQHQFYMYWLCLVGFKNVISKNRKKYGLQIQIQHLNEEQNYYLAEYLWKNMCSHQSLRNSKIRLQWIKIYRVFYFYYTPVITMYKLKQNVQIKNRGEFKLSEEQFKEIQNNIMDFIPDINWFSVYDSNGKAHKKNIQSFQESRRKKIQKQQLQFQGKNYITRFILDNPGRQSWEQLAKHALKWIISYYDDKETDNPNEERYKQIVQRLKDVSSFLKRGNTPTGYNLQKFKRDVSRVLDDFNEENDDVVQLFNMVENTLQQIQNQKRQRNHDNNGTTIMLPKSILEKENYISREQ